MAAGLGHLRLSPDALWSMSPREFAAAIGSFIVPAGAPSRHDLSALMRRFPDAQVVRAGHA